MEVVMEEVTEEEEVEVTIGVLEVLEMARIPNTA